MIELNFDSLNQLKIFFYLLNREKPIERNKIAFSTNIPRTTVFDNLVKLYHKTINFRPYINKVIICNHKRGRDKVLWFVSGFIRKYFFIVDLYPVIKVDGNIVNSDVIQISK